MFDLMLVKGEKVSELRKAVFAEEQGYPENKLFDEFENSADFLAVLNDGRVVGCSRFYKESNESYHIDNIAFGKEMRGKGFGKQLITALVDECKKNGAKVVTVNARTDAVGFYEKCGFAICGLEFKDETFSRVPMVKSFEFDGCSYVGNTENIDAFYLKQNFSAENVKSAVVRFNAMGFAEPYFNGKKLTDEKFLPAFSHYEKRDLSGASFPIFDTMVCRRYYLEYDVTSLLQKENAFVLHVGNGWYCQKDNHAEGLPVWGVPKAIFKIIVTLNDGSVTEINSGEETLCKESYVKHTNIYNNETIDGREYDESILLPQNNLDWQNAVCHLFTPAVFSKQDFSGDKIDYSIGFELIKNDENGKLYELNKDVSGLFVVKFSDDAAAGDEVTVSIAEKIDENGDFILRHTGGERRLQCDKFICGKEKREFANIFTWRAGKFVKLQGNAELVRFDVVYSPVNATAELKTLNENLKWLLDAYINTQNCNTHSMIPSDCPHRERLGYTGDGQLCSGAGMTIFDSEKMYRKWLDDIADCQDIFGGHVQHTAPMMGGGGGPGGWGGAICIVPWQFYKKFGDEHILKKYFPRMKKYLDYMASRCDNNIVVREEKDGWCLGDWCAPDNNNLIPEPFVNTYFYIKCLLLTKQTAEILGFEDDVLSFDETLKTVCGAFYREYYNEKSGSFCDGIQGADAFAIDIGLGDDRTKVNLFKHYSDLGRYDTGIFGTDIVTRVLFELGYSELAFKLMTNDSEISFANMKRGNTGTLWENWDGCDSLSHPMFGAVCEYIFTYILGIKQAEDSAGFDSVEINPAVLPELGDISGSITTVKGKISVEVTYCDGVRAVKFTLPENTALCE